MSAVVVTAFVSPLATLSTSVSLLSTLPLGFTPAVPLLTPPASVADAVHWDRIARNPAARATPPKAKRKDMKIWMPGQLRQFLESVRGDRLYVAFHLLATTGMRRGEVLGLRWTDLDLDSPRATVRIRQTLQRVGGALALGEPKSPKSRRTIALPNEAPSLRSLCLMCSY